MQYQFDILLRNLYNAGKDLHSIGHYQPFYFIIWEMIFFYIMFIYGFGFIFLTHIYDQNNIKTWQQ